MKPGGEGAVEGTTNLKNKTKSEHSDRMFYYVGFVNSSGCCSVLFLVFVSGVTSVFRNLCLTNRNKQLLRTIAILDSIVHHSTQA